MKDMLKKVFKHWEMFLVIFLILEFVVFGAANPKFLRPQSIMNSIVNYISVCIISLFVTMVMITGGIDIQAPAIIGLSSIIIGTVLASLIICILRYGLPLCFGVSTQNLDLPIGLILVVVVLGREIAGQHMLSHLFKRKKG